jgi:BlaI family transcriptional regulator, penicillinase repressor
MKYFCVRYLENVAFSERETQGMSKHPLDQLGELQRAVMEAVWQLGQASVRQVWQQLSRKKELAYTTVLTAMQRLEQAGWLRHHMDGKKNIYQATRTREQAGIKSVQRLIQRMYEGSAFLMFQHLVDEGELKDEDLMKLRALIDKKRKERQE